MSTDLIAFITARLDEDEAAAKAAWGVEWDWRYVARPFGERPSIAHTVHIARHDPARVLREVEAKRAMLAELTRWPFDYRPGCNDPIRLFVHLLAAPYSDHPDYQQEWKP